MRARVLSALVILLAATVARAQETGAPASSREAPAAMPGDPAQAGGPPADVLAEPEPDPEIEVADFDEPDSDLAAIAALTPRADLPGGPFDATALAAAFLRPGWAVEPVAPRPTAASRNATASARVPVPGAGAASDLALTGDAPLLSATGLLRQGDRLVLSGLRLPGRQGTGLDWRLPLRAGSQASLLLRHDESLSSAQPAQSAAIQNETQSAHLRWRRPLLDGPLRAELQADWRVQDESRRLEGNALSSSARRDTTLGLDLNRAMTLGQWQLGAARVEGLAGSGPQLQDYGLWRGRIRMESGLPALGTVRVRLDGQLAPDGVLPGAALFAAGGEGSVRGYAPGALVGRGGLAAGVEWSRPIASGGEGATRLDASVFVDHGVVLPSGGGAAERITGVGAGLWLRAGRDLSLRLTFAQPWDDRPANGFNRTWVNAQLGFTLR